MYCKLHFIANKTRTYCIKWGNCPYFFKKHSKFYKYVLKIKTNKSPSWHKRNTLLS